jgi:aminoglycoside phosphotransferase family enzyme/predicted kinase
MNNVKVNLPTQLAGLLDAETYPHPVMAIRVIETHISWVILTGEYAYKIKRPVKFSFLDFTTLAQREFFCREELRLNQRFAPQLYIDVCPIVRRGTRLQMNGAGEALEFAVRMRQFDPACELGILLENGHVTIKEIVAFGNTLAASHTSLPRMPSNLEPGRTRSILLDNARECLEATRDNASRESVRQCAWRLREEIQRLQELLVVRDKLGFVRECHGDLHASNVARIDGRLLAFDCLEFNEEFRRIDIAQEVAFLTMDLCAYGRATLASAFVNTWLMATGDYQACECLDLYEAHYALVRAKVGALAATRADGRERNAATNRQHVFVSIAAARLHRKPPLLILMHGLSGSGKSWLAERLARELPAIHIRSDLERKRLAGLQQLEASHSGIASELYAADQTERVYQRLNQCARHALSGARTAIVDASFLQRSARQQFVRSAAELGVRIVTVACQAPGAMLKARIETRASTGLDPSEANVEVLDWQRQQMEPVVEDEHLAVIDAHTERVSVLHDVLTQLQAHIADCGISG